MVNLQISMHTEESIDDTCSKIQLYVNRCLEAELSGGNQSVVRNLSISEPTVQIELVRRYSPNPESSAKPECGPIKKTLLEAIGAIVATFVIANSLVEPFSCTHEARETFMVEGVENNSTICCACGFDERMIYPKFSISFKGCSVRSQNKEYSISETELHTEYAQRKRYIGLIATISSVCFLALLLIGVFSRNYVTAFFACIVLAIIACCWAVSAIHLQKLFQTFLKKV